MDRSITAEVSSRLRNIVRGAGVDCSQIGVRVRRSSAITMIGPLQPDAMPERIDRRSPAFGPSEKR